MRPRVVRWFNRRNTHRDLLTPGPRDGRGQPGPVLAELDLSSAKDDRVA
jgi:hypothetical protein